jgi:hypothetical protein
MIGIALVTLASFLIAIYIAVQVAIQNRKILRLESQIQQLLSRAASLSAGDAWKWERPVLENRRIAIQISQDHERPTFAQRLKEALIAEDSTISVATTSHPVDYAETDIYISGEVKCNGYEELFFDATIDCFDRDGLILTVAERPGQGGRQANLSNTLVTRLKSDLRQTASRRERQQALDQLGS